MDRVLFFFAGGEGFWWSLPPLAILLAVAARGRKFHGGTRVFLNLGLVFTGACVFLGGPPLAGWIYLLWALAVGCSIVAIQPRVAARGWPPKLAAFVAGGFALLLTIYEWPYLRTNPLSRLGLDEREIYVIGDSLSAGIGAEERTWSQVLRDDNGWRIVNLAVPGARLHDAAQVQAPRVQAESSAVILMIGGNDLVKRVDPEEFKRDLEELIEALAAPDRLLVMVELPGIPGYRRYAGAQRSVSRGHGVVLIPRRYLARVFLSPDATVDGLHFSDAGHQEWARLLLHVAEDGRGGR